MCLLLAFDFLFTNLYFPTTLFFNASRIAVSLKEVSACAVPFGRHPLFHVCWGSCVFACVVSKEPKETVGLLVKLMGGVMIVSLDGNCSGSVLLSGHCSGAV